MTIRVLIAEDQAIVRRGLRLLLESQPDITVVGEADRYRTVTGYTVTPVVGVVPPDLPFRPSEAEVASVFEVPLDFLLDTANHVEARSQWQGQERRYYEIIWGERRIWGATAAMIVNLARRLRWSA